MSYTYYLDDSAMTTVTHKILGDGKIVSESNDYVLVKFENGEAKIFPAEAIHDPRYFNVVTASNNDKIKIERVVIKRLFDDNDLDYDINIDTSNCVAIFSAPNGCGKTTIFKLLMFVLKPSAEALAELAAIPFDRFSCVLSNGKTISLSRVSITDAKVKDRASETALRAFRLFEALVDLQYGISEGDKKAETISFIKTGEEAFNLKQHGILDTEEMGDSYPAGMGMSAFTPFVNKIKELLIKQHCHASIDFIEANRLQKAYPKTAARSLLVRRSEDTSLMSRKSELEKVDYLTKANEDITKDIQAQVREYNRRLTEAKNKLPEMYINAPDKEESDYSSFKKRWNNYHKELKKFYEIGVLDSVETVIKPSELEDAFSKKASFLMTYLDAFEETLEPLQKNYEKMKLFVDIFNKRNEITHKTIKFTQTGIKVSSREKPIDIERLSSGEKNDFVMFYRLIFNSDKNGIVLIDEPEISLHIEWQEEYLDRLIDICKTNSLQAIVATHSPNIVNGHIELFVDKR